MNYGLPAGLEGYAKCPIDGCFVKVYGPIGHPSNCREHGGHPALQESCNEYGDTEYARAEQPVPPPAVPAALIDLGPLED